jgi:hypothetical protein
MMMITKTLTLIIDKSISMNSGQLITFLYDEVSKVHYNDDQANSLSRQILWSVFIPTVEPLLRYIDAWIGLDQTSIQDLDPYDEFFIDKCGNLKVIYLLTFWLMKFHVLFLLYVPETYPVQENGSLEFAKLRKITLR